MENLIGKKFGRLVVVEQLVKGKGVCLCRCDCGNIKKVRTDHLKRGCTLSCGCLQKERVSISNSKHNKSLSKLYGVWSSMKSRCYNKNNDKYKNYGGRGISVCNDWRNDFSKFFSWAKNNGYKKGLTIDRIDVNGNYCPENCRWVDYKQQARNKTTNIKIMFQGKLIGMSEVAEILGIKYSRFVWRYKSGKTFDEIVSMG